MTNLTYLLVAVGLAHVIWRATVKWELRHRAREGFPLSRRAVSEGKR